MMPCRKVKRLFSHYLDNELSQKDNNWLDEHLTACPKCAYEVWQLQNTICFVRDVFSQMEQVKFPADFTKRFYRKLSLLNEV